MMNKVSVFTPERRFKKFEKKIKKTALRILELLKEKNVSVEICLIDNRRMKYLNKKFRGQDKTTTVLSFEEPRNFIYPPERGKTQKIKRIGEVYLNLDNSELITQNSKLYYLAHGLLHLLGYNHKKKDDRMKMEKMEQLVMRTAKFYK